MTATATNKVAHQLWAKWSRGGLDTVPAPSRAADLARELVTSFGYADGVEVADRLPAALGWGCLEVRLSAADGGQRAALLPLPGACFTILHDPDPSPSESWLTAFLDDRARGRALRRWRVAHEIAHTLFYEPASPPRRLLPAAPTEERFCDAFADALLSGPLVGWTDATELVALAAASQVPPWSGSRSGDWMAGGHAERVDGQWRTRVDSHSRAGLAARAAASDAVQQSLREPPANGDGDARTFAFVAVGGRGDTSICLQATRATRYGAP